MHWRAAITLLCFLALSAPARAQREYFNWYFGDSAGISFVAPSPQPSALLNGKVKFPQGAASLSDDAGRFLFASDGYALWDRNWRLMPGRNVSQVLLNYSTNRRQVMVLPQPGSSSRFYVFVSQREFYTNEYPVGGASRLYLPYVVVDTNARNGLGGIVRRDSVQLPGWVLHIQAPIYGLTGNWAAVRHANGRDLWLVGVATEGQYVSWLLSSAGLSAAPVVSVAPRWLSSNGILKASPDGRRLAYLVNSREQNGGRTYGRLELSAFDPATGQVRNVQELPTRFKGYGWYSNQNGGGGVLANLQGLEFSPDGARLYADSAGLYPLQYDLLAGSPGAIDASRTQIRHVTPRPNLGQRLQDMKLGPDGKIYLVYGDEQVSCIAAPNVLGNACQLQASALSLRPRQSSFGTLPLSPNDLNLPPVVVSSAGSISVGTACPGEPVAFLSSLSPFVTAAAYAWDFGDPASGPLNTSAGQAPVHRYAQGGVYTVTLRVTAVDGRQFTTTQTVRIIPGPVVDLGPDLNVCADQAVTLKAGTQPSGSTYRWQNGSTGAQLTVAEAGMYRLTVTGPTGCETSDEVAVSIADCPNLPNIITANGDGQNDFFVLKGLRATDWCCQIFNRWGRSVYQADSYANDWAAAQQPAGVYYYVLRNLSTGQQIKGTVEVMR
ncbi:hypothetical protein B0919_06175 [Hymenobacter sp. CRA2]|nr:hypothetical protein B0919_06175 [Hymenobacter sp. CRA2]